MPWKIILWLSCACNAYKYVMHTQPHIIRIYYAHWNFRNVAICVCSRSSSTLVICSFVIRHQHAYLTTKNISDSETSDLRLAFTRTVLKKPSWWDTGNVSPSETIGSHNLGTVEGRLDGNRGRETVADCHTHNLPVSSYQQFRHIILFHPRPSTELLDLEEEKKNNLA